MPDGLVTQAWTIPTMVDVERSLVFVSFSIRGSFAEGNIAVRLASPTVVNMRRASVGPAGRIVLTVVDLSALDVGVFNGLRVIRDCIEFTTGIELNATLPVQFVSGRRLLFTSYSLAETTLSNAAFFHSRFDTSTDITNDILFSRSEAGANTDTPQTLCYQAVSWTGGAVTTREVLFTMPDGETVFPTNNFSPVITPSQSATLISYRTRDISPLSVDGLVTARNLGNNRVRLERAGPVGEVIGTAQVIDFGAGAVTSPLDVAMNGQEFINPTPLQPNSALLLSGGWQSFGRAMSTASASDLAVLATLSPPSLVFERNTESQTVTAEYTSVDLSNLVSATTTSTSLTTTAASTSTAALSTVVIAPNSSTTQSDFPGNVEIQSGGELVVQWTRTTTIAGTLTVQNNAVLRIVNVSSSATFLVLSASAIDGEFNSQISSIIAEPSAECESAAITNSEYSQSSLSVTAVASGCSSNSLSKKTIIGIAVGAAIGGILLALLVVLLTVVVRRKHTAQANERLQGNSMDKLDRNSKSNYRAY